MGVDINYKSYGWQNGPPLPAPQAGWVLKTVSYAVWWVNPPKLAKIRKIQNKIF